MTLFFFCIWHILWARKWRQLNGNISVRQSHKHPQESRWTQPMISRKTTRYLRESRICISLVFTNKVYHISNLHDRRELNGEMDWPESWFRFSYKRLWPIQHIWADTSTISSNQSPVPSTLSGTLCELPSVLRIPGKGILLTYWVHQELTNI